MNNDFIPKAGDIVQSRILRTKWVVLYNNDAESKFILVDKGLAMSDDQIGYITHGDGNWSLNETEWEIIGFDKNMVVLYGYEIK